MRRKGLPLPPKVSVVTLLEPEDARELDLFCQATDRSRGAVIRLLLHNLLNYNPAPDKLDTITEWRAKWSKVREKTSG